MVTCCAVTIAFLRSHIINNTIDCSNTVMVKQDKLVSAQSWGKNSQKEHMV